MSQTESTISVDRIEGSIAVIEQNGITAEIPLSMLPTGTQEGHSLCICYNEEDQNTSLAEAEARIKRLEESSAFESNDDGSFDL